MAVRKTNYVTPGRSQSSRPSKNRVTPGAKARSSGPGGVVGLVKKGVEKYEQTRAQNIARGSGKVSGYTSGSYRQTPSSPARGRSAASERMTAQAGRKTTAAAPTAAGRKRVTVKSGDTLSSIAKREGVSLAALKQANRGRAVLDRIYSGSKVIIPKKK